MKTIRILGAALLMTMVLAVNVSLAAFVSPTLSYQGYLYQTDGTPVDGIKKLTFKLYNVATGGTPIWTEVQNSVTITKGHYSTVLGNISGLNINLSFPSDTWLGITVENDPEMASREKLTSVPYAFNAGNATNSTTAANGVPSGGIIMWSGAVNSVPSGWALCDGNNGTPDLRGRFIVGASTTTGPGLSQYNLGAKGGEERHTLSMGEMPRHNHINDGHYRLTMYHDAGWNTVTAVDTTPGEPDVWGNGKEPEYNGNNESHENRPPYYALAYIMKL